MFSEATPEMGLFAKRSLRSRRRTIEWTVGVILMLLRLAGGVGSIVHRGKKTTVEIIRAYPNPPVYHRRVILKSVRLDPI